MPLKLFGKKYKTWGGARRSLMRKQGYSKSVANAIIAKHRKETRKGRRKGSKRKR